MSNYFYIARQLPAFAFVVLSLGSTGSFAYTTGCPDAEGFPLNGCTLPGLVDGSFPYFDNVVSVDYKDKGDGAFAIRAKTYKGSVDNHLVVDGATDYLIGKPKYDLKASVDGEAASGTLKISGSIDGEKFSVTADLAGDWNSSGDGTLWGFNTTNIECSELINALTGGCTSDEVVYLNLLEAIGPQTGFDRISTAGRALTSVPVPAAAWLFGSGLLGLAGMARRWSA